MLFKFRPDGRAGPLLYQVLFVCLAVLSVRLSVCLIARKSQKLFSNFLSSFDRMSLDLISPADFFSEVFLLAAFWAVLRAKQCQIGTL